MIIVWCLTGPDRLGDVNLFFIESMDRARSFINDIGRSRRMLKAYQQSSDMEVLNRLGIY